MRSIAGFVSDMFQSKWIGRHKRQGDLRAGPLSWGFLTQEEVQNLATQHYTTDLGAKLMEITESNHPDDDWFNSDFNRIGAKALFDHGHSHADVISGVTHAYYNVAEQFALNDATRNRSVRTILSQGQREPELPESASKSANDESANMRFQKLDICSPSLSRFIDAVLDSYQSTHFVLPRLVINSVDSRIIRVQIEQGSAQKPGQVLGMFDWYEIQWNLQSGAMGPEALNAMQRAGEETGEPRRLVVTVQYRVSETFWFDSSEPIDTSASISTTPPEAAAAHGGPDSEEYNYHIWQFEMDVMGNDRQWRVRNINEVLSPVDGVVGFDTRNENTKMSIDCTGNWRR